MMNSTVESQIIALAKQGVRPAIIADRINREPATVYYYLKKARNAGEDIPLFERGPVRPRLSTILAIDPEDTAKLRVAAARRNIPLRELCRQLMHVVARDGLTSAILDDGGPADV